jgi:hypothetical protein
VAHCGIYKKARKSLNDPMEIRKPNRVVRVYSQRLAGSPAQVFPLLCPVREVDWIEGWDPIAVISESGSAEAGCVFVTSATPADAVWVITQHDPDAGVIEMLKLSPGVTVCRLRIELAATAAGCDARISYEHTSLGAAGDAFVAGFTAEFYEQFIRDWEARLNHYLSTGRRLSLHLR